MNSPPSPPLAAATSLPPPAIAALFASLEVATATDPGREPSKQVNEDSTLARVTRHGFLAVVCDGMGGHVGGREASQLAIATIFRVFDETPDATPPGNLLSHAIREANSVVFARGKNEPELRGLGSTCVAILVHPAGVEVAHVGDSRVYLLTRQQVYQVTKDHSLVQRLVDANMITPEEAANHPNANQITNALGMRPDVEVELRAHPFTLNAGDTFILCSDGLSDECGPQDLLATLAPHPACEAVAQQLIDLANARGGHDNITVVVVRFEGGAPFALQDAATAQLKTPTAFPVDTTLGLGQPASSSTRTLDLSAGPISGGSGTIPPPGTPPPFQPAPPPYSPGPPTPIEPPRRRKKRPLVAIVVAVLSLVCVAVAWAVGWRSDHHDGSGSAGASSEAAADDDTGPVRPRRKPRTDAGVLNDLDLDDAAPPDPRTLRNPRTAPEPSAPGHSALPSLPGSGAAPAASASAPTAPGLPGGIGDLMKEHPPKAPDLPGTLGSAAASMPPVPPVLPVPPGVASAPSALPALPERTK